MKKNLALIILVLVVVGGLYFMSSKDKSSKEVENVNENNSAQLDTADNSLTVVSLESKATYEINEVLKGTPTHVVGNSSALTGTVSFNKDTKKIEGAKIVLDANSLATDISMRDGNVKNLVLRTDEPGNEVITFNLTSFEGSPESSLGTDVSATIIGDLTIAGVTKSVTFVGTANMSAEGVLTVNANTVLTYGDFGIAVPELSFLANVSKTVKLTVHIVAK